MATTILVAAALTALSAGASYLAYRLNKPKQPKPFVDDRQPTLAIRGSPLGVLIGRRKITPVVGYDGELKSKKVKAGGKGGSNKTSGYVYEKAGIHWLCVGPITSLYRIWENGKVIWEGPIHQSSTPSGSLIQTDDHGSFYIWWGELQQPVNSRMAQPGRFGVASRWPGIAYVEWRPKKLGNQVTWGQLDYECEAKIYQSQLAGTPDWLDATVPDMGGAGGACVPINAGLALPAGTYTITYRHGALRYDGPENKWRVNRQPGAEGYFVRTAAGADVVMAPGDTNDYSSQQAVEAANAGKNASFTLAASTVIKLCLVNSNYENNFPGNPNPTFEITNAATGFRTMVTGAGRPDDPGTNRGSGDSGVNLAHALYFILTAPAPWGVGMPSIWLDGGAFDAMGVICQNEHLVVNIFARDAITAEQLITELMEECGFFLPQIGEELVPVMIRPAGGTIPLITDDMKVDPNPEVTQQHGESTPTSYIFQVYDRNFDYKPQDLSLMDDATSRMYGYRIPKTYQFNHLTDQRTGYAAALRRQKEEAVDGETYSLKLSRQGRLLYPGQVFDLEGVGRLRVASIKPAWDTTAVEVQAVFDQYGTQPSSYLPLVVQNISAVEAILPVYRDIHVTVKQLPAQLVGSNAAGIGVARVRGDQAMDSAYVWVSANGGSSYMPIGTQDGVAAGGTLNRPLPIDEMDVSQEIDIGPTFTSWNDEVLDLLDLTANLPEWESGRQVAIIDDEWFLVKKVEATSGGWRLRGLRRGAYGTTIAAHAVNSPVVIFTRGDHKSFYGGVIQPGAILRVKVQPISAGGAVDLATITPIVLTIV